MENIEVALRIRPINQQELENNDIEIWTTQAADEVGISAEKYSDLIRMRKIAPGQKTQYLFNKCFDQSQQNSTVYEQVVKRIALSSLKGINGTVFMYGQTGSGKTFTMMGQNREEGLNNINCNSKHNLSLQQQMQSGSNSAKLIGDPLSPKNLISKESSSRLSRQQSSHKNLVSSQKPNNGQQQQQQQYYSKSPPKQRDSVSLNNTKENQDNSGNMNQYAVINTLRGPTQLNDKNNYQGIGAFKNSTFNFSPMNSRDNFFKKKNSNQQAPFGVQNRSQSVTPDKYLSGNSQKSQMTNPTSQNALEVFQDSQGFNQKQQVNYAQNDGFNSIASSSLQNTNQFGVLILSLIDIFREIQNSPNNQFLLRCSYVEIYTDFVYDLLKPQEKLTETLQIGEDYNKEFYIKGAVEEIVSSIDEIIQLLKYGEYNRHYASTAMNHISSRSHTIFRLYVRTMPRDFTSGNEGITESILNFVDLAGSEKINIHNTNNKASLNNLFSTNNSGNNSVKDRQIESKTINKSLFFLTQVISLKSSGKQESHIPYRNSPLTKILRSSLGGNSRTAIILCLNPCLSQLEQSVSTLRFGLNAKKIENQVKQNVIQLQNNDILQGMIKEYETRIVELESEKNLNKVNSDNLVKMIQALIEQKSNLEKRIKAKELFDQQQHAQRQVVFGKKRKNYNQDFIHLDNVGLIKVFDESIESGSEKPYSSRDVSKEIQGNKCAMRKIKNINEQKKVLEEQTQQLRFQLQQKEVEQNKMMQRLDKKLAGKKRKLQTMKANKITLGIENSRLKQELALYKNQNIEGLKKLSVSKLEKLEQNVELLLKNIRNQMSTLAIKKEFEGDTAILQRINKTLQLRELMDCELVELANDFFEPNLQLNTTLYDDDDSMMYNDTNDNFQYHNIHNAVCIGQDSNDLLEQQRYMQTHTTNEMKSKFIPESPLLFGVSPRDTVSCLSYKGDEQYQFMNSTQNQYNNLNQQTSLTNLTQMQTTQRYGNSKSNLNSVLGTMQENQIEKNTSGTSQNFGTFQNYFNQVNSNNQKNKQQYIPSSNQQVSSDNSNFDSEGTSHRFGMNPSVQNNNYNAEESRSSTNSETGKLQISELNNLNKNWNQKVYTHDDILNEKQFQQQVKQENNSLVSVPTKSTISTQYNQKANEFYPQGQNIVTTGLLNSDEYSVQQSIFQSQQTCGRGSGLDQNNDQTYLNSFAVQATSSSRIQNLNASQPYDSKNGYKVNTEQQQSILSGKQNSVQSPLNGNYIKGDLQQHPARSCSQGQNYRSNQYVTNDINCEASALTQDFQEPHCLDKEVRNYSSQHKNRWDAQKNNNRQPSKDQYESGESKYITNQTQFSQTQNITNTYQNHPHHHSSNSEVGLSEKKLVEKLFGKENKYQGDSSLHNQSKVSGRDGALQASKINHNSNNSQQKYQQSMKKTLSQKDILGSKLQIIMNQNNNSSISNTTFAHLAMQHQQNRHIVQQLMGNQPSRSSQNIMMQPNSQGVQSPTASPKHSTQQNNFMESGSSYLKLDSTYNRTSANQNVK